MATVKVMGMAMVMVARLTLPAAMVPTLLVGVKSMFDWEQITERELGGAYPQAQRVDPPRIEHARRAWRISVQPLSEDEEVDLIIADLERGSDVRVLDGGTLHHDPNCNWHHAYEYSAHLRSLQQRFEVVLVDCGPHRNPLLFCPRPEISSRTFPRHPHLRLDKTALIDGKPVNGLCVYLASDGVYRRNSCSLIQVLDFTMTYLAKHVVWQRTARLSFIAGDGTRTVLMNDDTGLGLHLPHRQTPAGLYVWEGHWPGPAAPHDVRVLFETLSPTAECPCGSGDAYRDCCRGEHGRNRGAVAV